LEKGYGYVRISQFQSRTREDLARALNNLLEENNKLLHGVVLDLRNNPGGVLNAAVDVADVFLKRGLIVYTEGRVDNAVLRFKARPKVMLYDTPLVVLVNGGSASASEIVAGALQDHKRAIIMGTKTFGKGSVQTIMPMNNKSALKLTTALYFTPKGRSIQAEGINPDIVLESVKIEAVESEVPESLKGVAEADLRGHLDNDTRKDRVPDNLQGDADDSQEGNSQEEPLIKRDYQLYEALNLLKGLHIVKAVRQ
jgi:carboxyl-terminal processing protease